MERQRNQEIRQIENEIEEKLKTEDVRAHEVARNRRAHEEFERRMMERIEELREMNRVEKSNRVVIDKIFDIVRSWTDIEFLFCHLVGIVSVHQMNFKFGCFKKQVLENVGEKNEAVKKVRTNMVVSGRRNERSFNGSSCRKKES